MADHLLGECFVRVELSRLLSGVVSSRHRKTPEVISQTNIYGLSYFHFKKSKLNGFLRASARKLFGTLYISVRIT
jgi:hypothetical protein